MVQVYTGGVDTFDALAFGEPHPSTFQFLQQEMAAPTPMLNQIGQQFMAGARALYDRVSGSTAMRTAQAVRRRISAMFQENSIKALNTIAELQHAPPTMRRWIMADPVTRKLYQEQRIDGYGSDYIDREPGVRGADHYDYRRVMDGIVTMDDEDGWTSTTYLDVLLPDDRDLTLAEQTDILQTWESVSGWYLKYEDDPTSRWNARLG